MPRSKDINREVYNNLSNNDTIPKGLIIHGTVVKRTKRTVNSKNGLVEIVTYIIEGDNNKKWFVDDYAPEDYYDKLDIVSIPVYIKPYQKKSGGLSYTINVQKEFQYSAQGEDF